jgi:ribose 1,5-bisphosphokinase PhnN
LARRQEMPTKLPNPLPQPNVLHKANRRRGYIGREAAEEKEKDARRAQKQAKQEAKVTRIKNKAVS